MDLNIQSPLPARNDFRIGILGSGFIVNDCHLVAYRRAGFNPAAIASRHRENAKRVAQRHGILKVYECYEQLLDDPAIDVLDIAVPPDAQLGLIKAAAQRGTVKGILAQKPLGTNYAEACEAVRACQAAGIALAVNQNMRYDQSVRAAKTLLDRGVFGEPVLATLEMRGIPHWMPWQAQLGWVTLRIMSIHHLDCFRHWFGDPERIFASIRPDPRTDFPHSDGICSYILEYASGLRCVGLDDTWTGPAKEGCPADLYIRWRIEGLDGLAIGDIGWCKDPCTTPSTIRWAAKGDAAFHEPRWTESWFPDAFIGTMAQLLIALETGTEPAISGRDNLKTMALVEAAYLSAAQGRTVNPGEMAHLAQPGSQGGTGASLDWLFDVQWTPGPEDETCCFTPHAQQALAFARKEAERHHHSFVGTEHLLLGLVKLGQGPAVRILQGLGLTREGIENEVERRIASGPDPQAASNIPFTPRVKKVFALAAQAARALHQSYVGTEHILLGLLREGDGLAARVLTTLGASLERAAQPLLRPPEEARSNVTG
jgi:predicted dehydrogenase